MNIMQQQLIDWHKEFGVLVNDKPTIPSQLVKDLRKRLITEEAITELFDAIDADNMVEIADALADALYVIFGTAVSYGIDIEPIFNEVHRSNMSKLWPGGFVKRDDGGKVIKPPSYSPAKILPLLRKQGY